MQNSKIRKKISGYLELVIFSHSLFSLPLGIATLFLCKVPFSFRHILCIAALILARSGANAYNRFADRKFDRQNKRTRGRNIPRGDVSSTEALIITGVCFLLLGAIAVILGPTTTLGFPVAVILSVLYSYSKRFTPYCHLLLGVCCGLSVAGCSVAMLGGINVSTGILYLATVFRICSHDIIYQIEDIDFDRVAGLYSYPAVYGEKLSIEVAKVFEFSSYFLFSLLFFVENLGLIYALGLFIAFLKTAFDYRFLNRDTRRFAYVNNALCSCILSLSICIDIIV